MKNLVGIFSFALALFLAADTVPLKCWIVADDMGQGGRSEASVSNLIAGVNAIYAQVAMKFSIFSISTTNRTEWTNVDLTNRVQYTALCAIERNSGFLELYFVPQLTGVATAFHTRGGIVIGPNANARTVAHEIGHACRLVDIYVQRADQGLTVTGLPTKARLPDDWGWYPPEVKQVDVIQRLLMYGVFSTNKVDLSYGDVYGVYYTNSWDRTARKWNKVWLMDNAPVGFGRHGTRTPTSR